MTTRTSQAAGGALAAGLVGLCIAFVATWSALRNTAYLTCTDRGGPPPGAANQGESIDLSSSLNLFPLGLFCSYPMRDGSTATRFANIASPVEFLCLIALVGALILGTRHVDAVSAAVLTVVPLVGIGLAGAGIDFLLTPRTVGGAETGALAVTLICTGAALGLGAIAAAVVRHLKHRREATAMPRGHADD